MRHNLCPRFYLRFHLINFYFYPPLIYIGFSHTLYNTISGGFSHTLYTISGFQSPRCWCWAGRTCSWRQGAWSTWRALSPGPPDPRPPPPGDTTTASSPSGGPGLGSPSSSTRGTSPRRSFSSCPPGPERSMWSLWFKDSSLNFQIQRLRSIHVCPGQCPVY